MRVLIKLPDHLAPLTLEELNAVFMLSPVNTPVYKAEKVKLNVHAENGMQLYINARKITQDGRSLGILGHQLAQLGVQRMAVYLDRYGADPAVFRGGDFSSHLSEQIRIGRNMYNSDHRPHKDTVTPVTLTTDTRSYSS